MLDSKADQEKIIKLYPRALNDRCDGGALPGHHILVYARPERGKTLWALNMCAGFMKQMKRVCYFCNEEPIKDYKERLRMRLLKQPKGKLRAEPEKSQAALAAMQLGDLYFIETRSFAQARNHIYRLKPDVVVFDQLRNMETGQEGKTQQLDIAATSARAIAKDYGVLVVSVTQAGDSASGKVYLQMNDVDSSKTGIPAAVDLMIGLGGDDAMQATGLLGVSLPKNKLSGLHEQFVVEYDVSTGVIK
jgi:predicted ATP-dependent serine protease